MFVARLTFTPARLRHIVKGLSQHRLYSEMARQSVMIVGLGNLDRPNSRHSIGMEYVDKMADMFDVQWRRNRTLKGLVGQMNINEVNQSVEQGIATSSQTEVNSPALSLIFIKSMIPMNGSGKTVSLAAKHYEIPPSHIYLVHDELDREVGRYNLKKGGSAGGHNGVRSCQDCLRSDVMPRLRLGISRPASKSDVVRYVLSDFIPDEKVIVDVGIEKATPFLLNIITKQTGTMLNIDIKHANRRIKRSSETG